jgi:putative oxidoreductase
MSARGPAVARIVLGSVFFLFGFDGLLHFFPMPPMPDAASRVIAVLVGYRLFYAVKVLEIGAGAALLLNRFTSIALLVLAPILFNIAWFDANLDLKSLPVAGLLAALEGYLLWQQRARLVPLFARRT